MNGAKSAADTLTLEYARSAGLNMKLNKRGKRVRAVLILVGVSVLVWWMTAGLWWTGTGWCAGSMSECVGI